MRTDNWISVASFKAGPRYGTGVRLRFPLARLRIATTRRFARANVCRECMRYVFSIGTRKKVAQKVHISTRDIEDKTFIPRERCDKNDVSALMSIYFVPLMIGHVSL